MPVISSEQLLEWLTARDASSFEAFSWAGDTMNFTIHADARANGLRAMLPVAGRGGTLTSLSRGGVAVPYTTQTIKGVAYAVFGGGERRLRSRLRLALANTSQAASWSLRRVRE